MFYGRQILGFNELTTPDQFQGISSLECLFKN